MRQQFWTHKGHRLWLRIWVGCPKHGVPAIKAGSVLPGRDTVTRIKSLTWAGGFTFAGRSGPPCRPGVGPAAISDAGRLVVRCRARRDRHGASPVWLLSACHRLARWGSELLSVPKSQCYSTPGPGKDAGLRAKVGGQLLWPSLWGFDQQERHRSPCQ